MDVLVCDRYLSHIVHTVALGVDAAAPSRDVTDHGYQRFSELRPFISL